MLIFQNYHRHSHYTNPRVSDSVASNEDYAKRAAELGHGIISTCEHGTTGRYIEGYELAQKYGLKFVMGTEAYWVRDRAEKDRTNCHIYLGAKNEVGRQAINDVMSEAAISGFYGQPRIDIPLILSLPRNDIFVTTACVAYWKYDDAENITLQFADHFQDNLYLEVQYHNTEKQRILNERILSLSEKRGIPIIMGCDSHYIGGSGEMDRADFIASKGMEYSDEAGWYMDYPDGDEAYKRFAQQCVLDHGQIIAAIENTSIFLGVEEYCNPCFTQEIKMTTLYPDLTQDEKDAKYDAAVWGGWEKEKANIPQEEWDTYEHEIQREIDIVHATKHADYFLLDKAIVKRGKERGGVITPSGRGSGVSFYTNKLLGFTDVDRIAAKVKMYPERFMSPTRILEAKTLADLDLNLGNVEPFAKAQEEIVGVGHAAPMIAYGTMKPKAAWKMYAKSQNVDFDIANEVSVQIGKYEKALIHASEDEKDSIDVHDFIERRFHEIYDQSEIYRGVVVSASIHPCSYLLYNGDIRKEIGLTRAKDKIVCCMDGKWAEEYKFLKNDLLKVSVVDLIDRVYKRIGKQRHTIRELLAECQPDSPVWDIYKKGCTLGINQCEQDGTRQRVMKYAPRNISELCAFVAAIRPGFKSMYKIFEERKPFSYGIKSLDTLIQTDEMPNSFILYQEQSMAVLHYAGIPMSECYEIIKNIAKKRVEKVLKYKAEFIDGFSGVLMTNEGQSAQQAKTLSDKVWQILEDSSRYSFNASHSYSVAIDSLYGAFLKTHYPLEFYETFLRILEVKGDKDRMAAVKDEAESYFKIKFPPYRFGQDNRSVVANHDTHEITNTISAIKGFGDAVGEVLYQCGQCGFHTFIDILLWLDEHGIKASKTTPLIQIGYFSEYGNIPTLIAISDAFEYFKQGKAKSINKGKENPYIECMSGFSTDRNAKGVELKSHTITDCVGLLNHCEQVIRAKNLPDLPYKQKAMMQLDLLGYADLTTGLEADRYKILITDVKPLADKNNGSVWGYRVFTKSIGSGKTAALTCYANVYKSDPFVKGDILQSDEKHIRKNKSGYWYLHDYRILES